MLAANASGIAEAAKLLTLGKLVAFPTETVYGLGADARNDHAVAGIFAAKNRPGFNPLIVHVHDLVAARQIAVFDDGALRLAKSFWPGPLTLVLPLRAQAGISPLVTAGLPSIALRVPEAALARDLMAEVAIPIAAPSANPSGRVSAVSADHVATHLGTRIDAILDGGACAVGVESTILDLTASPAQLLRPGGVDTEALQTFLGAPLAPATPTTTRPNAPGQLPSHYAPLGQVRLNVTDPISDEILLGFGDVVAPLNLSPTGNLREAAANLFHLLHQLDALGARKIAVSPIPDHGLGRAINDRLRRAAAPRQDSDAAATPARPSPTT